MEVAPGLLFINTFFLLLLNWARKYHLIRYYYDSKINENDIYQSTTTTTTTAEEEEAEEEEEDAIVGYYSDNGNSRGNYNTSYQSQYAIDYRRDTGGANQRGQTTTTRMASTHSNQTTRGDKQDDYIYDESD